MIVKELRAHIMCPECNEGFDYSALGIHNHIETVYKMYLGPQIRKCTQCEKANMIVRDVKCIMKGDKSKCSVSWRCLNCDTTWKQSEYLDKDVLASGKTIRRIMPRVTCPNVFCLGRIDVMVTGVSRE